MPPEVNWVAIHAIEEIQFWRDRKHPAKIVPPAYKPPKPRVDGINPSAADRTARHYIPRDLRFTPWCWNLKPGLRTLRDYMRVGDRGILLYAYNDLLPEKQREPSADSGTVFDGCPVVDPRSEQARLYVSAMTAGQKPGTETRLTVKVAVLRGLDSSKAMQVPQIVKQLRKRGTKLTADQVRYCIEKIERWRPDDLGEERKQELKELLAK